MIFLKWIALNNAYKLREDFVLRVKTDHCDEMGSK